MFLGKCLCHPGDCEAFPYRNVVCLFFITSSLFLIPVNRKESRDEGGGEFRGPDELARVLDQAFLLWVSALGLEINSLTCVI